MKKRLLSLVLALSMAIPNTVMASESVQTPSVNNTEEVESNDVPVVVSKEDLSAKEEKLVKNAPTVVEHTINADNPYGAYSLLTTDNPVYVETNKQLPIGITIQSDNIKDNHSKQGEVSIFLSALENTEWHSGNYELKVHEKQGDSWKHVKTVNLTVTNSNSPTANTNVHFTKTTPSNIFLKPGEEFALADTLSNGSPVEYITDRVQLFLDKAMDDGPNPKQSGTNEDEIFKASITGPNLVYTSAYVNDKYHGKYKDRVFKIENGKIKAVNYGSALIWATDAGRNVFYPIAINVRDSDRVFTYKQESATLKETHNLYAHGGASYNPVTSFVNTTGIQKAFNASSIPLTLNSKGYSNEATTHNMLYSDKGVLSAAMHEWRKANGKYKYTVKLNRTQNNGSNNLTLTNNYYGLDTSWAVHELIHWGTDVKNKVINHVDAMWFVTSKPNTIVASAAGSSLSLKVGERCERDISNFFSGGTGVLRFTTTNAPAGTSLSISGVLSGTPTGNERSMTVRAIDAFGNSSTLAIPLSIEQPAPPTPPPAQQQQKPKEAVVVIPEKKRYTISATKTGQGTIDVVSSAGSGYAYEGDSIAINATPAEGYVVGSVTLDGQTKTTAFVSKSDVQGNTTYSVEFVPKLRVKDNVDTTNLDISQHIEGGKAPYRYDLINAPSGVTINNSTGQVSITGDESKVGTVQITDASMNKQYTSSSYVKTKVVTEPELLGGAWEEDTTGDYFGIYTFRVDNRNPIVDFSVLRASVNVDGSHLSSESLQLPTNFQGMNKYNDDIWVITDWSSCPKEFLSVINVDGKVYPILVKISIGDTSVRVLPQNTSSGSIEIGKEWYNPGEIVTGRLVPSSGYVGASYDVEMILNVPTRDGYTQTVNYTVDSPEINIKIPSNCSYYIEITPNFRLETPSEAESRVGIKQLVHVMSMPFGITTNYGDILHAGHHTVPIWNLFQFSKEISSYHIEVSGESITYSDVGNYIDPNRVIILDQDKSISNEDVLFSITDKETRETGQFVIRFIFQGLKTSTLDDFYDTDLHFVGDEYLYDLKSIPSISNLINDGYELIFDKSNYECSYGLNLSLDGIVSGKITEVPQYRLTSVVFYAIKQGCDIEKRRIYFGLDKIYNEHKLETDIPLVVEKGKSLDICVRGTSSEGFIRYAKDTIEDYLITVYPAQLVTESSPRPIIMADNALIQEISYPVYKIEGTDIITKDLNIEVTPLDNCTLHVEWFNKTLEIPIRVIEPLPERIEITKELGNIEFNFYMPDLIDEYLNKDEDIERFDFQVLDSRDIDNKGSFNYNGNGTTATGVLAGNSAKVEFLVTDLYLDNKQSTLVLNLLPQYFTVVSDSFGSGAYQVLWSGESSITNEFNNHLDGKAYAPGDLITATINIDNPNKELDYLNITYYTLGNFNGDGYLFSEDKTEKVYLNNSDTWKYYVDGRYAKLDIKPVLKDKLKLTNADLNVESSTWYLTHGLDQHVTGGVEPYRFAVKSSTYSNGLSVNQNNEICGDVPEDGSATVTVYDSQGKSLDFDLTINVPDPVRIIINNNENHGTVAGVHEDTRAKLGDILSFGVYAAPELKVKSIDVNEDTYKTHLVEDYEIRDNQVEITTAYEKSITFNGKDITGGIPPYTYAIKENGGYDQIKLRDNKSLKLYVDGELEDGYYEVLIEAKDSSPEPLTCEFWMGHEHVNEEIDWHSILVPELSGGSIEVTANEISERLDGYSVPDGTEITIKAEPIEGFKFNNWVRPNVTTAETKLTVTNDIMLLANFSEVPQANTEEPDPGPDPSPEPGPEPEDIPPIKLESRIKMKYGDALNLKDYTTGGEGNYVYVQQETHPFISIHNNGDVILSDEVERNEYGLLVLIGDGSSSVYTSFILEVDRPSGKVDIEVPSPDPGPYPLPYPVPTEWVLPFVYEKVSGPNAVVINRDTGAMSIDGEIPVGSYVVVVGVTDSSSPANYEEFSYILNVYPKNPEIPTGPIEIKVPSDPVPVGPIEGWVPPFKYDKIEGHEGINIIDNKWVVDADVPSGEHKMVYKITDARGKYIIKDFEVTVIKGDEDIIIKWPTNEEVVIDPSIPDDWKLPVKYYKEDGHTSLVVAEDTGAISVTGDIEPGEYIVSIRMEDSSEPKKSKIYTVNVKIKEGAGLALPNAGYFLIYIPLDGEPVLPSIKDRLYGYDEPISIVDIDTTDGLSISDNDLITADSTVTSGRYTMQVQVSDATHEAETFELPVRVVRVPADSTTITIPGNGEIEPIVPEEDEWREPYTYTKVGGHDSIYVDANTGTITVDNNIPSGDYEVIIRVTDSSTPAKSKDYTRNISVKNYSTRIEINGNDPITVTIPKAPTPVVWPNLEDMTTGGVGPYTYEIIGDDSKMSISDNCLVVSDGRDSGDYLVYFRVKDSVGNESTVEKIVTVVRRTKYLVESNILPENAGTVDLSNVDDTVSANAVSNKDYVFSHYVVYDEEVRENPYTFDLHIDTVIDAHFNEKMRTNHNTNANQSKDNTVYIYISDYFEGGTAPYKYTLKEDYDGLSIREDGVITGKVSENGLSIVVNVSDNSLPSDTLEVPITINPMHKYTPIVKIRGLGTVSIDKLLYTEGEEATFVAYPSEGYVFKYFYYDGEELTDKTVKFAMTEDFRILAVFEKDFVTRKPGEGEDPLDLNNYVEGGEGEIEFEGKDLPDGITIDENDKVVIDKDKVLPGTYTIIIDATDENGNKISFEVIFDVEDPLKSVTPGEGEDKMDLDNYVDGGKGEITFEPVDLPNGFTIDDENRIVVDDSVEPGTYTVVVDAIDEAGNKIVIVVEVEVEDSLRNTTPKEGEDKMDLDNYVEGGKGTITYEPIQLPDGFIIDDNNVIIVDEDKVEPGKYEVIVDAIDEAGNKITIEVEVIIDDEGNTDVEDKVEFDVTSALTPSNAGTVQLSSTKVEKDGIVTATANAYSGYEFVMWVVEGKEYSSNPLQYMITNDTEIVAVYRYSNKLDMDNLSPNGDEHPPITGDDTSNVVDLDDIIEGGTEGKTIEIIDIPDGVIYNEEEGTFTNETEEDKEVVIKITEGDKSVIVVIVVPGIPMLTVHVNTLPENSGIVSGNTTYAAGDVVTLTAIPNDGVKFSCWDIEGVEVANYYSDTLTFVMPKHEVIVTAIFDDPDSDEVPTGIWFRGVTEYDYTGSAIKPVFRVYDGAKLLREKFDYTVSYKNNKNAYTVSENSAEFNAKKAPTVNLKFKGNYKGTRPIYFTINPVDINDVNGLVDVVAVTVKGKKVTIKPNLTWNNKKLNKKDFVVESVSGNNISVTGTHDMQIVGKGNFSGTFKFKAMVNTDAKIVPVSKIKVTKMPTLTYTGKELIPTGFVIKNGKDIPETDEYAISFRNNTAIGKGEMIITGTGKDSDKDGISYVGQHVFNFKIVGPSIKKATISGLDKSYKFTGERIKPDFSIIVEGKTLKENKDYTLEYANNLNKGKAKITVKAIESAGYTGTRTLSFNITPEDNLSVSFNSVSNNTFMFNKKGTKPEVVVYDGVTVLEEGVDYTVSYKNNKKVATLNDKKAPTVVVTGKGNYKGKTQLSFNIIPTALTEENGIKLIVADKVVSPKKGGYVSKFTVYDSDGAKLTTKDYDKKSVTYTISGNSTPLTKNDTVSVNSTIVVTVIGKGNYAGGQISTTYNIIPEGTDISKATVKILPQQYTGKEVTITEMEQFNNGKVVLKSKGSSTELVLDEDFIIVEDSYINNIKRGTAKVTLKGIGNYGGQKTVTFKIGHRTVNDFWTGLFNLIDLF